MDKKLKIDKSYFSVSKSFDETETKEFWWNKTPEERLEQMEILRRINYGDKATERLQRVLEVVRKK